MTARKPGVRFNRVHQGVFARRAGAGSSLRFSTYARLLRANGMPPEVLAEFEREKAEFGSTCPTHGTLEDPVIGIVGAGAEMRVAFACPWCSSPEVLAAWEREGARS